MYVGNVGITLVREKKLMQCSRRRFTDDDEKVKDLKVCDVWSLRRRVNLAET